MECWSTFAVRVVEVVPALDRRAVGPEELPVPLDERPEVRTPDLLLALHDELEVDRQVPRDALPPLDREDL